MRLPAAGSFILEPRGRRCGTQAYAYAPRGHLSTKVVRSENYLHRVCGRAVSLLRPERADLGVPDLPGTTLYAREKHH